MVAIDWTRFPRSTTNNSDRRSNYSDIPCGALRRICSVRSGRLQAFWLSISIRREFDFQRNRELLQTGGSRRPFLLCLNEVRDKKEPGRSDSAAGERPPAPPVFLR